MREPNIYVYDPLLFKAPDGLVHRRGRRRYIVAVKDNGVYYRKAYGELFASDDLRDLDFHYHESAARRAAIEQFGYSKLARDYERRTTE